MMDDSADRPEVIEAYGQRASRYDRVVRLFDIFAWLDFNISGWRKAQKKRLKSGK